MKMHTIFVEGPFSGRVDQSQLIVNCVGQKIAFDGRSTLYDARSAATELAGHCAKVELFSGDDPALLVASWINGELQPHPKKAGVK